MVASALEFRHTLACLLACHCAFDASCKSTAGSHASWHAVHLQAKRALALPCEPPTSLGPPVDQPGTGNWQQPRTACCWSGKTKWSLDAAGCTVAMQQKQQIQACPNSLGFAVFGVCIFGDCLGFEEGAAYWFLQTSCGIALLQGRIGVHEYTQMGPRAILQTSLSMRGRRLELCKGSSY